MEARAFGIPNVAPLRLPSLCINANSCRWKYYLVYIAINIAYIVYFYFYLIDTRGLPLEEVTLLFDYPRRTAREQAHAEMENRIQAEEERQRGLGKLDADNFPADDKASEERIEVAQVAK